MPIHSIIRYPDPRLALPAQPVAAFDDELRALADDLLETMHAAPGIGITAPHIGISLRIVVLQPCSPNRRGADLCQSEITWASPEMILHPGRQRLDARRLNDEVSRHARVRISYHDIDQPADQNPRVARCTHQHEIDQLNGLFWIKRLSRLKRERLIKRFEKVSRG